ncbi:hypothetical protein Tco_0710664 [Tanacetum coccineum]
MKSLEGQGLRFFVGIGVGVGGCRRGVNGGIGGGMVVAAAVEVLGIIDTGMCLLVKHYPSLEIELQSQMIQKNFAVELQFPVCHEQL